PESEASSRWIRDDEMQWMPLATHVRTSAGQGQPALSALTGDILKLLATLEGNFREAGGEGGGISDFHQPRRRHARASTVRVAGRRGAGIGDIAVRQFRAWRSSLVGSSRAHPPDANHELDRIY